MNSPVTGVLRDRFPYTRIGAGRQHLVVLPGLSLTNTPSGALVAKGYAQAFRRLAADHTLHIVQRPRGLPAGAGTADIAGQYAELIRDELGPVRLLGLSTGGMIAQQLALAHPDLVDRLILVVTGATLAERGRAICVGWRRLATAGRWRRLHGDLGAAAVDGTATRWAARALLALAGRKPSPVDAADSLTTVDAVLGHDTTTRLAGITAPTFVAGGAIDPFFPEPSLRATAAAIPGARLRVYAGSGHGVPKHRAGELQDDITAFLRS